MAARSSREQVGGDALADPVRLQAVSRSGLLSSSDRAFDRYTRLAHAALDTPVSLFTVIDERQQYVVAQSGLGDPWPEREETELDLSIWQRVVVDDQPLVVDDGQHDERVSDSDALAGRAYLGVPVRDHNGNVLGSLCVVDHRPRTWNDAQVDVLRDLADALETEIRLRAASATLSTRLHSERRQLALVEALATAASAASGTNSRLATAEALIAHGAAAVGAASMSLALIDDGELLLHHDSAATSGVTVEPARVSLSADLPMAVAGATGRTIQLSDRGDIERWPSFRSRAAQLELESFLAVPIGSAGAPSAVIGLGWTEPMDQADPPSSVERLVALAGRALDSSERFESEQDHARALQGIVLPPLLPSMTTIDLAGSYLAPRRGQRVGGDVYDAIVREDGAVGMLVGDAVGHDLLAARTSVLLRHAVAMLFLDGASPDEILRSVHRYVAGAVDRRLATATVLLIDPAASTATVANAGHPRPILVHRSQASELGPEGQPLLGLVSFDYRESVHDFPPGAAIVAYTDGLLERARTKVADASELARSTLGASATETVRGLMATVDEYNRDDVAVLVAQHRSGDVDREQGRPLQIMTAPERLDLAAVRRRVRGWVRRAMGAHSSPTTLIDDLELVATELLSNAKNASPRSDSPIGLRIDVVEDGSS